MPPCSYFLPTMKPAVIVIVVVVVIVEVVFNLIQGAYRQAQMQVVEKSKCQRDGDD